MDYDPGPHHQHILSLSAMISQWMTYTIEYGRVLYYMNFTGYRPIINFGRKGRRVLKNANVV